MTAIELLQNALVKYYQAHQIDPDHFDCKYFCDCKGSCADFTEARMPGVGVGYGCEGMPRVLVVSLDPGDERRESSERGVCIMQPTDNVYQWHKNRHWYLTHELVWRMLGPLRPGLELHQVPALFAHTNSAKCCMNKKENRQADSRLFINCRGYMKGEMVVLDPDVVISQGDLARKAVRSAVTVKEERRCDGAGHKCWWACVTMPSGRTGLWFHTYHPNQRSGLYGKNREGYYECYSGVIESTFAGR